MLFKQAIDFYKQYMLTVDRTVETIKGYTIELNLLCRYLSQRYNGPVYIEEITVEDLEEYFHMLKQKGNAPVSRSRTVYIIRSFYNFCYKKGYVSNNLGIKLEAIPVPEKERVFLTAEEMKELVSEVKPPITKLIVNTLFYTGMRISECLNLKIGDVDLKEAVITVKNTKNKKDRQIPIHGDLIRLLLNFSENWRNGDKNPYFFCLDNTHKISPDHVNRELHKATQNLGWNKHVTCHIIRHSFASHLVARNVNIVNIQKLLGHSDLSTTSIYTHTNIDELKKAVSLI